MSAITIRDAVKKFGDFVAIKKINLEIRDGEFFTLLGPSGCGKTTLLRMIAGFNSIEGGQILFNDTVINNVEPSKRNIGMVFQNYAVFPHMSVRDNIAFGLKERKVAKDEIRRRVDEMMRLVQIEEHAEKKPNQLSGGQQQRVALARAIVIKPDVLLMDEPLSNLDAKLRLELRDTIRNIQREVGITTVYVTHDQEEAMAISDRIAVMRAGVIEHLGVPKEIYHRPRNTFTASFIGRSNSLNATLEPATEGSTMVLKSGDRIPYPFLDVVAATPVVVSIRPEDLYIADDGPITAKVLDQIFLGTSSHYHLKLQDGTVIEMISESSMAEEQVFAENVKLDLKTRKINVFSADGTENLVGDLK